MKVFGPDEVRALPVEVVLDAIRQALTDHATGALVSPARAGAELVDGTRMVFTCASLQDEWYGYRSYDTLRDLDQLVVLHAWTGELAAVVTGDALGPRRTGAIGALAADALSAEGPLRLAVVGTGPQARAQVWALAALRELEVLVHTRRPERAEAFVAWAREDLHAEAVACRTIEEALGPADVAVLATSSSAPVAPTELLARLNHVSTIGPKSVEGSELPPDLLDRADLVVTDSLAQLHSYSPRHIAHDHHVEELGSILTAQETSIRDGLTVFCSTGLAGTELSVAAALLARSGGGPTGAQAEPAPPGGAHPCPPRSAFSP